MNIAETVLLSAALSIDALTIGISCGFGGIRVGLRSRMIMLMVSVAVTGAAVAAGIWLRGVVPEAAGRITGSGLLFLLGIYMLHGGLKKRRGAVKEKSEGRLPLPAGILGDPDRCDTDSSLTIDCREAAALGAALSADSFAAGISAGMSAGAAVFVPLMCGVFQMVLFRMGEMTAGRLRRKGGEGNYRFSMLSGAILMVTALIRLVM